MTEKSISREYQNGWRKRPYVAHRKRYAQRLRRLWRRLGLAAAPLCLVATVTAVAAPCNEGPRLYETDRSAYERQARRVFAAWGVPHSAHRQYELDHRIPRCLGGSDADDNLWPQPLPEALMKDQLERAACRMVCGGLMPLPDAIKLFDDWQRGYLQLFGREP